MLYGECWRYQDWVGEFKALGLYGFGEFCQSLQLNFYLEGLAFVSSLEKVWFQKVLESWWVVGSFRWKQTFVSSNLVGWLWSLGFRRLFRVIVNLGEFIQVWISLGTKQQLVLRWEEELFVFFFGCKLGITVCYVVLVIFNVKE